MFILFMVYFMVILQTATSRLSAIDANSVAESRVLGSQFMRIGRSIGGLVRKPFKCLLSAGPCDKKAWKSHSSVPISKLVQRRLNGGPHGLGNF